MTDNSATDCPVLLKIGTMVHTIFVIKLRVIGAMPGSLKWKCFAIATFNLYCGYEHIDVFLFQEG